MAWRSERASLTDLRRFRVTAVATEHQPIVPAAHAPSNYLRSTRSLPSLNSPSVDDPDGVSREDSCTALFSHQADADLTQQLRDLAPDTTDDAWIAATAMSLAVPVVTQDADYVEVQGLQVIKV